MVSFSKDYVPAPNRYDHRVFWIDLLNHNAWLHSGEMATYTSWNDGEPNHKGWLCAHLEITGVWRDGDCERKNPYVCEILN